MRLSASGTRLLLMNVPDSLSAQGGYSKAVCIFIKWGDMEVSKRVFGSTFPGKKACSKRGHRTGKVYE
ncbi:MAG: hypothetical protein WBH03_24210, partial [Cyclobacteriaceae bacterium]